MEMDTVSCSAAVSACEKVSEWQWALQLLMAMGQAEVKKNIISCNSATHGLLCAAQWKRILSILGEMATCSVELDLDTHTMVSMECEQRCLARHDLAFFQMYFGLDCNVSNEQ